MDQYIYTTENNFLKPNSYMYTEYGGEIFLKHYIDDRRFRLNRLFNKNIDSASCDLIKSLKKYIVKSLKFYEVIPISHFSLNEEIISKDILLSLLFKIANDDLLDGLIWIDRLVQRFEVTKKIYEKYEAGFRKGKYKFNNINRYIEFATCLVFTFDETKNFQYLSTLIKVMDLILSIDKSNLVKTNSMDQINLICNAEILFVKKLIFENKIEI